MPLRLFIASVAFLALNSASGLAQQASSGEVVEPPDVLVRVQTVAGELELIRFVMGRPENQQPDMGVEGAAPREVYFQALTMFRKAERLCFELTREHTEPPEPPDGKPGPADVLAVVDATFDCLSRVKTNLGISERSDPPARDADGTPTDVFRATVQANRQLNLLLEQRSAPSDVFQQVTRGVGYASRLLKSFPDATTLPDEPEFEVGKRPSDVYSRLLECFDRIHRIAKTSGVEILELKATDDQIARAEPSDVYDIASRLVSELADQAAPLVPGVGGRWRGDAGFDAAGIDLAAKLRQPPGGSSRTNYAQPDPGAGRRAAVVGQPAGLDATGRARLQGRTRRRLERGNRTRNGRDGGVEPPVD